MKAPVARRPTTKLETDKVIHFDENDVPSNQPSARFAGKVAAKPRPEDPLLPWLGETPQKLGPIMVPDANLPWMERSVFNPSAIVKDDGKIALLFRAEDGTGRGQWNGTSRIGYAESTDGIHFEIRPEPVLGPTEVYEEQGGTEDPRVVRLQDGPLAGKYLMTYTAYSFPDKMARLALAVSTDLLHWEKKGVLFERPNIEAARPEWSKSGAIVPRQVNGEYLMYFGDSNIHLARSKDGIHWVADPEPVLKPRPGYFDGNLVESGPTPWLDAQGNIHMLYNADAPPDGYAAGEVVFSGKNPREILSRSNTPVLKVTEDWEKHGQVGSVIFLEGLAVKDGEAFFYYGGADDKIAVAVSKTRESSETPK